MLPLSVINGQPLSVKPDHYRARMESASKKTLRENVRAIIAFRAGINPEDVGVGRVIQLNLPNGTAQRLLGTDSDLRMDTIDVIARGLGVESWQLLVPALDPSKLPVIAGDTKPWPFQMVDELRYRALSAESRAFVQAKMDAAIEQREMQEKTQIKSAA